MEHATRFTNYQAYLQLAVHKLWKHIVEGGEEQPERIESPTRGAPNLLQKWKDFWQEGPSMIAPGLYVGSAADAASATTLAELNVRLVVNCTPDIPQFFDTFKEDGGLEYVRVPIVDGPNASFQKQAAVVRAAVQRISRVRSAGGTVLVHCLMGASRSVCVACLALLDLDLQHTSADEVYERVREARRPARINVAFMEDLREKNAWWWSDDNNHEEEDSSVAAMGDDEASSSESN